MARSFWLSDEIWARIGPHLPHDQPGKSRVDDKRVISGILHVPNCLRHRRADHPPVRGHPNGTLQAQSSRRPAAQSVRAPVFGRLKDWRRVASRYDRLSCNDRAAVARVSCVIAWAWMSPLTS